MARTSRCRAATTRRRSSRAHRDRWCSSPPGAGPSCSARHASSSATPRSARAGSATAAACCAGRRTPSMRAQADAIAGVAASAFGLVGVGGVDFVDDGRVMHPIEVNPRWTASMELVERARGLSVFRRARRRVRARRVAGHRRRVGGPPRACRARQGHRVRASRRDRRRHARVADRPHRPRHPAPRHAHRCSTAGVHRAGPRRGRSRLLPGARASRGRRLRAVGASGPGSPHECEAVQQAADLLWDHWSGGTRLDHIPDEHAPGHARRGLRHPGARRGAQRGAALRLEDRGDEQGRPGAHRRGRPAGRAAAARAGVRERRHGAVWRQPHARGRSRVRVPNGAGPASARRGLLRGGSAGRGRQPASGDRGARLALQRLHRGRCRRS